MTAFQQRLSELEQRNVSLAALSVDKPAISAAYKEELGLEFTLLCDYGRDVVKSWDRFNRFEMGGIAQPTLFIIDTDRVVRFRSDGNMTRRMSVDDLLVFLDSGTEIADLKTPYRRSWVVPSPAMLLRAGVRFLSRLIRWDT